MKVLMINGSPKADACIGTALKIASEVYAENGIETEILHIGNKRRSNAFFRRESKSRNGKNGPNSRAMIKNRITMIFSQLIRLGLEISCSCSCS